VEMRVLPSCVQQMFIAGRTFAVEFSVTVVVQCNMLSWVGMILTSQMTHNRSLASADEVWLGWWWVVLGCDQLQHLVTDVTCVQLMELYNNSNASSTSAGSAAASQLSLAAYQRKAEQLLTDENCFRLTLVSCPSWHVSMMALWWRSF